MSHAGRTEPPSAWIERFVALLPEGSNVLDLACGAGRHTRLLAAAGHRVTAVDRDPAGTEDLIGNERIRLVTADLEDSSPWPVGGERFDGVVVTNYLWRPILPAVLAAVDQGGLLLYETFAEGNERFGKPKNPDFLLRPGELLELVRQDFEAIAFEQGVVDRPKPAAVQRICARRAVGGDLPPLPG